MPKITSTPVANSNNECVKFETFHKFEKITLKYDLRTITMLKWNILSHVTSHGIRR